MDEQRTVRALAPTGLGVLGLFVLLRWAEGFGNSHPIPRSPTVVGFLHLTKYPPSITYLLASLGVGLVCMGVSSYLTRPLEPIGRILERYGRVPLFFYMTHLFMFGVIGTAFPHGASVAATYLIWALGVIGLFFACRAYGAFRSGTPTDSIWRAL